MVGKTRLSPLHCDLPSRIEESQAIYTWRGRYYRSGSIEILIRNLVSSGTVIVEDKSGTSLPQTSDVVGVFMNFSLVLLATSESLWNSFPLRTLLKTRSDNDIPVFASLGKGGVVFPSVGCGVLLLLLFWSNCSFRIGYIMYVYTRILSMFYTWVSPRPTNSEFKGEVSSLLLPRYLSGLRAYYRSFIKRNPSTPLLDVSLFPIK